MKYALLFTVAAVLLTLSAVATFDHISTVSLAASSMTAMPPLPPADTLPTAGIASPVMPTAADYARFADADRAWRDSAARRYSVAELRQRGDGRRTPREVMQDRVYRGTRRGDAAGAIAELERWVARYPRDARALVSLARLLNETGRADAAIARYRQALAVDPRVGGEE